MRTMTAGIEIKRSKKRVHNRRRGTNRRGKYTFRISSAEFTRLLDAWDTDCARNVHSTRGPQRRKPDMEHHPTQCRPVTKNHREYRHGCKRLQDRPHDAESRLFITDLTSLQTRKAPRSRYSPKVSKTQPAPATRWSNDQFPIRALRVDHAGQLPLDGRGG